MSMRIDAALTPSSGGVQIRFDTGSFAASLRVGDEISVQVLSSNKDAVVMKAENGQIFRARVESPVSFALGDLVLLQVSGSEDGSVFLSIKETIESVDKSAYAEAERSFEDKSLLPYANRLADLNLPVTEDSARVMVKLLFKYPDMTMEQAAFIAANGLATDESLVEAALIALSRNEDTSSLIASLSEILASEQEEALILESYMGVPSDSPVDIETLSVSARLDRLLELLENGSIDGSEIESFLNGGEIIDESKAMEAERDTITIGQWVALVQNGEIDKAHTMLHTNGLSNLTEGLSSVNEQERSPLVNGENIVFANVDMVTEQSDSILALNNANELEVALVGTNITENPAVLMDTAVDGYNEPLIESGEPDTISSNSMSQAAPFIDALSSTAVDDAKSAIVTLLSELEAFKDTPPPVLDRFSNMLLNATGNENNEINMESDKIANQLDGLFAQLSLENKDTGLELKRAREELFARLMLMEETISKASSPAKGEIIEQTRRLMDHVRLLDNIKEFAYMQIPININERKEAAELYVFKKRGNKPIDPENVNILLALELEHMGRWEGLISFKNKDVSVKMEVRGLDEKDAFSEQTYKLHELLAEIGFRLMGTEIGILETEATPINAKVKLETMTKGSLGIDVFV
ncbi:MAG: hypothetical protein FWG88_07915 [Oscillospiraceae bacterium]|nr:hypothetical protein [Oscillospiraceae bacterium]